MSDTRTIEREQIETEEITEYQCAMCETLDSPDQWYQADNIVRVEHNGEERYLCLSHANEFFDSPMTVAETDQQNSSSEITRSLTDDIVEMVSAILLLLISTWVTRQAILFVAS